MAMNGGGRLLRGAVHIAIICCFHFVPLCLQYFLKNEERGWLFVTYYQRVVCLGERHGGGGGHVQASWREHVSMVYTRLMQKAVNEGACKERSKG